MCKGFAGSVAELNSRVRLGFQFCSVALDLRERGKANRREDFIPSRFLSLYRSWCSWARWCRWLRCLFCEVPVGVCKHCWSSVLAVSFPQVWVGYSPFCLWLNLHSSELYLSCTILMADLKICLGSDSRVFHLFQGFVLFCDGVQWPMK